MACLREANIVACEYEAKSIDKRRHRNAGTRSTYYFALTLYLTMCFEYQVQFTGCDCKPTNRTMIRIVNTAKLLTGRLA